MDGDTLDAVVTRDLGFGGTVTFSVRLRLNRINAPKLKSDKGMASRARLVELLAGLASVDLSTVKPYKFSGPDDSGGEYMTEIALPDGRNISDVLVAEGLAVAWNGEGPRPEDS